MISSSFGTAALASHAVNMTSSPLCSCLLIMRKTEGNYFYDGVGGKFHIKYSWAWRAGTTFFILIFSTWLGLGLEFRHPHFETDSEGSFAGISDMCLEGFCLVLPLLFIN